ncbi:hypothetical protein, partial [Sulfurovum sp.]|uniref:hypothetical protein n=1 Tax=Sulfurovum sp. TaxID=1969726 RepID=UPI0025D35F4D
MSEKTEIHIDLDLLNTIKQDSYSEKEHPLKKYSDEIILKIFILREEYNLSFLNIARYIYSEYKFELTKGYAHTLYKKAKKSIKKDYSEKSRSSKNGGYCFSMKSPTKTHKNAKMGSAVGAENDQRKTLPKTESGGQQKTLPKESAKNSKKEVDSIRNNTENKPESTGQENMV